MAAPTTKRLQHKAKPQKGSGSSWEVIQHRPTTKDDAFEILMAY